MTVYVNEEKNVLEAQNNIAQLVDLLQLPPKGIAVAVNEGVIPRAQWNQYQLKENDKILIITASQGG